MKHWLLAIAGLLLTLSSGCSFSLVQPDQTSVSIRIGNELSRSLLGGMETFTLSGSGPVGAAFLLENLTLGEEVSVTGLAVGGWSLEALGYDSEGRLLVQAIGDVELVAGQANQVNLSLEPVQGLTIGVSFPQLNHPDLSFTEADSGYLVMSDGAQPFNLTAPSGFDSYQWYLDGVLQIEDTDATFLHETALPVGRFRFQVIVKDGSRYFSEEVLVIVAASGSGVPT